MFPEKENDDHSIKVGFFRENANCLVPTGREFYQLIDHTQRHEYFQGELLTLVGGSENHSLNTGNCIFALKDKWSGKGCRVYNSNMKLNIHTEDVFVYPDGQLLYGDSVYFEGRKDVSTNSPLIIEVLSPGTASFDRGGKFNSTKRTLPFRNVY